VPLFFRVYLGNWQCIRGAVKFFNSALSATARIVVSPFAGAFAKSPTSQRSFPGFNLRSVWPGEKWPGEMKPFARVLAST